MDITTDLDLQTLLNIYIADEFWAAEQYRMAKVVAKGGALDYANKVFGDNHDDEDEHFDELVTYAQSLEIPVQINPEQMKQNCSCPFVELSSDESTMQLVMILISAENKAIQGYELGLRNQKIIEEHPELVQFFGELLNDERTHLKELQDLKSNIEGNVQSAPQSIETESSEPTVAEGKYKELVISRSSNGEEDAKEIAKSLIQYAREDDVRSCVSANDLFDVSEISDDGMYGSTTPCSNKLYALVDEGQIQPMDVIQSLVEFLPDDGEYSIRDFAVYVGFEKNESVSRLEDDSAVEDELPGIAESFSFRSTYKSLFENIING